MCTIFKNAEIRHFVASNAISKRLYGRYQRTLILLSMRKHWLTTDPPLRMLWFRCPDKLSVFIAVPRLIVIPELPCPPIRIIISFIIFIVRSPRIYILSVPVRSPCTYLCQLQLFLIICIAGQPNSLTTGCSLYKRRLFQKVYSFVYFARHRDF